MKALVTGASCDAAMECIGTLLGAGFAVVGVSRGRPEIDHERFSWHCLDLSDERYTGGLANLSPAHDPIRVVIHFAPAAYLPAVRNVMAPHTGLLIAGKDWARDYHILAFEQTPEMLKCRA